MAADLKREQRQRGKNSLELIEESVHLLRRSHPSDLAWYFAGTWPFVLGALYFWADMSRSPFAAAHLVGGAVGLALLFLWMKTCHAVFSRRMHCLVSGHPFSQNSAQLIRIFLSQAALQPTGLFILPLSIIPALPFAWAYAFYQNLLVLDGGETFEVQTLVRKASRQALLWPQQNHCMLAILFAFGFFICLNVMTACFVLPALLKMLFGIETIFTRSGLSLLNTTFFAAVFGLGYICVDPIIKTVYAIRCFYGESQRSGADLKAELRLAASPRLAALIIPWFCVALTVRCLSAFAAGQSSAEQVDRVVAPTDKVTSSVAPSQLDQTIQEVIQQPKYAWRQPRARLVEPQGGGKGFFQRMFDRIKPFLVKSLKTIGRWLDTLLRRLFAQQRSPGSNDIASRWVTFMHLLLYALICVTVLGLLWLFFRIWQNRRNASPTISSVPLQPLPDLSDENLGAEQLPEEGWIEMARKLLANGELRLALRAFYLASLAQLSARNLIQLARFKSNHDYERELQRRAHAIPDLVAAFAENLTVFDRIWYGMYDVNQDLVFQFAQNVERMRGDRAAAPVGTGPS